MHPIITRQQLLRSLNNSLKMIVVNLIDHIEVLLSVAVSLLGVSFGYGKLSEKVKTLEAQLTVINQASKDRMDELEAETQTENDRLRADFRRDAETLDSKILALKSQIEILRTDFIRMRERIHQDMLTQTRLLHEIKGRLEGARHHDESA